MVWRMPVCMFYLVSFLFPLILCFFFQPSAPFLVFMMFRLFARLVRGKVGKRDVCAQSLLLQRGKGSVMDYRQNAEMRVWRGLGPAICPLRGIFRDGERWRPGCRDNGKRRHTPLTTSRTEAGSAKASRMNSGGLRCSILLRRIAEWL